MTYYMIVITMESGETQYKWLDALENTTMSSALSKVQQMRENFKDLIYTADVRPVTESMIARYYTEKQIENYKKQIESIKKRYAV